jgi:hypothetical protein
MSQTTLSNNVTSLDEAIEVVLADEDGRTTEFITATLSPWRNLAAEALTRAFLDEQRSRAERERATWPLYLYQGRRARCLLLDTALHYCDEWVRVEAVRVLAPYNNWRIITAMRTILADTRNSAELRSEAAHTLGMNWPGQRGNGTFVRSLMPFLHDPAPEVRLTVIYAIMQCDKKRRALNEIRKLINDHRPAPTWHWTVAQEARWAVVGICVKGRTNIDPDSPELLRDDWQNLIVAGKRAHRRR